MTPEDDIDQLPVTQQLGDLHITRAIAMEAVDSMINKMQIALEESANRYQDLFAKYLDLKDTVANNATHITGQVEDDGQAYVVAIIDAHSHNFMDPFLKGSDDDGAVAAKRVEEIITEILRRDHPELAGLRVLVHVHADVKLLCSQKEETRYGDVIKDSDSLRLFIQGFSSASSFSDFIDVSHEGCLEEKMKGVFEWHVQDLRCKHILFNIAEKSSTYSMIVTDPECKGRTTNIPKALARILPTYVSTKARTSPARNSERSGSDENNVPKSGGLSQGVHRHPQDSVSIVTDLSKKATYGYFENNRYIPVASQGTGPRRSFSGSGADENISRHLDAQPAGTDRLSINSAGHRIDAPLPTATQEDHRNFQSRTRRKKLCTQKHIVGRCTLKQCRYDHSPVTPGIVLALRHTLRHVPCHMQGECRMKGCFHGHQCVVQGCKGQGDRGCKFGIEAHNIDMNVDQRILPTSRRARALEKRAASGSMPEQSSHKGSMENWPTMVADLIEI